MNRISSYLTAAGLTLLMLGISGCPSNDDAFITCDNFDYYLDYCVPECSVTWDCEVYYDTLPVEDQIILDDCSDCLAINVDVGSCADCEYGNGYSCLAFFQDTLGLDCWASTNLTCEDFDYFLLECYPSCQVTWDCDLNYETLPIADQEILDSCSICLADNAELGICEDCVYGPNDDSCFDFMSVSLGVECF
jgi:hypothetical protein